MKVVSSLPSSKEFPLIASLHQMLKIQGFWNDREIMWLKKRPAMKEHDAEWQSLDARSQSVPANAEHVGEWQELCTKYSKMLPAILPGFGSPIRNRLIVAGLALLNTTAGWSVDTPDLAVAQVDATTKFAELLMIVDPGDARFAEHSRRLRKCLNTLGSAAIKRDVLGKSSAVAQNLGASPPLIALSSALKLASGVDLAQHADEVKATVDIAIEGFFKGELMDSTIDTIRSTMESMSTVARQAGLLKAVNTIETQMSIYIVIIAHKEFRKLRATYSDIAAVQSAEHKFGVLYRTVIAARQKIIDNEKTEIGLVLEKINTGALEDADKTLTEYAAIAVENKDRALLAKCACLAERVGCSIDAWDMVWCEGAVEFKDIQKLAKETICLPSNSKGLKDFINEVREVSP